VEFQENGRLERLGLKPRQHQQPPITFGALADKFLAQYTWTPRSKKTIEERIAYARKTFDTTLVRDLTTEGLSAWNASLTVGQTTRHNAWRAMKQVLGYGVACEYLTKNPATILRLPGPAKRQIKPFESWAEVYKVSEKAGKVYGPLIRFACATGLRPQEWQALEWRHIDFVQRELRVEQTVRSGKIESAAKTDGSLRTVKLQQVALDALADLTRPINGGLVFPAPEGGTVNLSNFRSRVWKDALKDAGVDYRAVDQTRHTFATLAIAAGADVAQVSRQLGHRKLQTTLSHYAKWLPQADNRYLTQLDTFAASQNRPEIGQAEETSS
jgi:integrase